MRPLLSFLALTSLALVTAAASFAHAPESSVPRAAQAATAASVVYGVAEDATKYAEDGGASLYPLMQNAGLSATRWTIRPNTSDEAFVARALPVAVANGVRVVGSVHSERGSEHDPVAFCTWLEAVARRFYPGIKDYIVWNEPNTRLFWNPQKDDAGNILSAGAYMELLTRCYTALKGVASDIRVIAFGLSPRASTPASTAPIPFIQKAGEWWRANGGGSLPFDAVAIHPYPNPNSASDAPDVGYPDPNNYGIPNIDRVKNAMRQAFGRLVPIVVDEIAWQVDTAALGGYSGTENVQVVGEATQAEYLKRMIQKYFACDPDIAMVLLFHLVDERERDGRNPNDPSQFISGGWQSGLFDISLRARAAVEAVRQAITGGCTGSAGGGQSPDAAFAILKKKLQGQIDTLQARVKSLAKQKRVTAKQAKLYLGVLNRLEANLQKMRFAKQTLAMQVTLKRLTQQIAKATRPVRRR
jgi:hypothetical protein